MDDFTREELDQLYAVFRDQSLMILEEMGEDMLLLEKKGSDEEAMVRLRRAAHTIKGDAACIGLEGVTELAHRIEDILDKVLSNEVRFDKPTVDLVLATLDAVQTAIGGQKIRDVSDEVVESLVGRIAQITHRDSPETTDQHELPAAEDRKVIEEGREEARKAGRDYLRVEAARIDALLNLAGEMVIARSVLNEIGPDLELALPKNELVPRFGDVSVQMAKLIAELQKSVLKMRMVTIDNVFRRFVRPMRELAAERGKSVALEISGGETELDRTLVDLLYEPLLHLLRNAVDHGLETTEERQREGKPVTGRINLKAYHEGNQVVVEVRDDGRGIDSQALMRKAMDAGLITEADAGRMNDDEAQELLFLPGLSTAVEISLVSGRGIGAATVKAAIEQLRGTITVKSEPGAGTLFILRMPLTLAIIKALLFSAAGQLFALPLLAVSEIARGCVDDIVHLDGLESLRLRDQFISMVRPGVVLGFDRRKGGSGAALRRGVERFFLIVLTVGNKKYGVVADSLLGEQELLIKPLDSKWVQNEALAGASVLGDGRVVLIMDAGMVFRKAVRYERSNGTGKGAYAV
ncbi:MAG TPA: chemotaxis protein CheA [Blastocatellia bacterium]|jgi:two-component system chemotaxis sensor kinase CheA|nr:chemotaxis protein CheA [Blastocatellia bacterium]